jgi:ABC-2 type transport system permease protein
MTVAEGEAGAALPIAYDVIEQRASKPRGELGKLGAFFRRDLLIAWSYRMGFVTDAGGLFIQAVMFYFIGKLIDPNALPTYDGSRAGYMEFVAAGIIISALLDLGLRQVASSIRQEQMMGTLESVLLTPTAIWTIQTGSVLYMLIYLPIRTVLFLAMIALAFGVQFSAAGILPAFLLLLLFLPFIWGLGLISAAGMLTYRVGGVGIGFVVVLLTLGSGAFFPLDVLPGWIQSISIANPIARAINGIREALIGGNWNGMPTNVLVLGVAAAITISLGTLAFKRALARELRRGTLGIY